MNTCEVQYFGNAERGKSIETFGYLEELRMKSQDLRDQSIAIIESSRQLRASYAAED